MKENGRLVMMFCSYGERPLIIRLHGRGQIIERADAEFDSLIQHFTSYPYIRAIVKLHIEHIADSCGWGVPKYEYLGHRDTHERFGEQGTDGQIPEGQLNKNMKSRDGLPGLTEPSV